MATVAPGLSLSAKSGNNSVNSASNIPPCRIDDRDRLERERGMEKDGKHHGTTMVNGIYDVHKVLREHAQLI